MRHTITWFAALTLLTLLSQPSTAEIPRLINYQGILENGEGGLLEGLHTLEFNVYADSTAGTPPLWTEIHADVMLEDGLFNVILGSIVAIPDTVFAGDQRWMGITADTGDELYPRQRITSVPWALRAAVADMALGGDVDWVVSGNDMYSGVSGNVGIGTTTPTSALDVLGGAIRARRNDDQYMEMRDNDYGGAHLTAYSPESNRKSLCIDNLFVGTGAPSGTTQIRFHVGNSSSPISAMTIKDNARVGIGTDDPDRQFEVSAGQAFARITSSSVNGSVLEIKSTDSSDLRVHGRIDFLDYSDYCRATIASRYLAHPSAASGIYLTVDGVHRMVITDNGRVGIGNINPEETLHVSGTVKAAVLKLDSGADIAEPFDVESAKEILEGMVVCIDPERPGKLRVSDGAYDRRVAGIISGAGTLDPGMLMGQAGTVADGSHPVALTGRVYCLADASNGPIEPGDLLTTSATPGHAMKVTDYSRAQGAVIGKSMESLQSGTGLVLVLVSLQ